MKRRTFLLTAAALPLISVAGMGGYSTPAGDEPIEKLFQHPARWEEFPFDNLVPGDIFRQIRFPGSGFFAVEGHPNKGGVVVVRSDGMPCEYRLTGG